MSPPSPSPPSATKGVKIEHGNGQSSISTVTSAPVTTDDRGDVASERPPEPAVIPEPFCTGREWRPADPGSQTTVLVGRKAGGAIPQGVPIVVNTVKMLHGRCTTAGSVRTTALRPLCFRKLSPRNRIPLQASSCLCPLPSCLRLLIPTSLLPSLAYTHSLPAFACVYPLPSCLRLLIPTPFLRLLAFTHHLPALVWGMFT